MNRFGHCEGHSFSLELETAIARAVESSSSLVSSQIIRRPLGPSVFHSEFDNFDQFVNDLSGKGSVHTAHGIMLQEVTNTQEDSSYQTPQVPKDKSRSLVTTVPELLEECYVSQRESPSLTIHRKTLPSSEHANRNAEKKDTAWLFLRTFKTQDQVIPGWGGFVSQAGGSPERLTSLDYYPVIYHPIIEYSTVQECL